MKHQPNRLDLPSDHALAGTAIDRGKPLKFRLNGHLIHGFAGDTVLSATIASGIDCVGLVDGQPIALDAGFAPPVVPAALFRDPQQAFPMERLPARDGLDLLTLPVGSYAGRRLRMLARLRGRLPRSLGIALGRRRTLAAAWRQLPVSRIEHCDIAVVGGGLAGMSAALAAARSGVSVVLIERRVLLGGNALLFGRIEGEEGPAEAIARLEGEIAAHEGITVMLSTDALSLTARELVVHRVTSKDGASYGEVLAIAAQQIVLAPGTIEQRPIFPGNRLPGVSTLTNAFHLAHHYGVWPGRTAMFATTVNAAYRLAMLAADAGISIARIIDHRPDPRSRFIEFCKAYGINRADGVRAERAVRARKGQRLAIHSAVALEDYFHQELPVEAARLVLCGGWIPDLGLWLSGGGDARWDAARGGLVAAGRIGAIELAGSAALTVGTDGCIDSGVRAVDLLLGRQPTAVRETRVDPIYESVDWTSPVSIEPSPGPDQPAYLGSGSGLMRRPPPSGPQAWSRLGLKLSKAGWTLADSAQTLGLGELAGAVATGLIPPTAAGIVARERAPATASGAAPVETPQPAGTAPLIPEFLHQRFGPDARVWEIRVLEERRLEAGSLLFPNSDTVDPVLAIGVVLMARDQRHALALFGPADATHGQGATLRDHNRPVPVRLMREYWPKADADPVRTVKT